MSQDLTDALIGVLGAAMAAALILALVLMWWGR